MKGVTITDLIRRDGREPGGGPAKGKWYKLSAYVYIPKGSTAVPAFKVAVQGKQGAELYLDNPSITGESPWMS